MKIITVNFCDAWKTRDSFGEAYVFTSGRALARFIRDAIKDQAIEVEQNKELIRSYAICMNAHALNGSLKFAYVEDVDINPEYIS